MSKKQILELQKELLVKEDYNKEILKDFKEYAKLSHAKEKILLETIKELKISNNFLEVKVKEAVEKIKTLANDWGKEITKTEEQKWQILELKSRNLWQRVLNK